MDRLNDGRNEQKGLMARRLKASKQQQQWRQASFDR
jgi:hypothetical protein